MYKSWFEFEEYVGENVWLEVNICDDNGAFFVCYALHFFEGFQGFGKVVECFSGKYCIKSFFEGKVFNICNAKLDVFVCFESLACFVNHVWRKINCNNGAVWELFCEFFCSNACAAADFKNVFCSSWDFRNGFVLQIPHPASKDKTVVCFCPLVKTVFVFLFFIHKLFAVRLCLTAKVSCFEHLYTNRFFITHSRKVL